MRCYECGSVYVDTTGDLKMSDDVIGDYFLRGVKYKKCQQCGKILLPNETWEVADNEYERVKEELIGKLPISEFIFAADAYSILNITRQAFHQNRRIRNGFIHSISKNGRKMYHKKSVELFCQNNDGRFVLHNDPAGDSVVYPESNNQLYSFLNGNVTIPIPPDFHIPDTTDLYQRETTTHD